MSFYRPLIRPTPLPQLHTSIERAVCDFKRRDAGTQFHRAKDLAAFANHLGGTIVVGAAEHDGYLRSYPGLTRAEAAQSRSASQDAIARCHPAPIVDIDDYECPGQEDLRIIAVNIAPSLDLVCVDVRNQRDETDDYGGTSYVFPVRTATATRYLQPPHIAMHMLPSIRRLAILLSRIPSGAPIRVIFNNAGNDYQVSTARFIALRDDDNYVEIERNDGKMRLSLDFIQTVYEGPHPNDTAHLWQIYYRQR